MRVISTGVGHRLAEPQRIELVADVVMMMDVLARAIETIGARSADRPAEGAYQCATCANLGAGAINGIEQVREISLDVDLARL